MKKYFSLSFATLAIVFAFFACEKKVDYTAVPVPTTGLAYIKFVHAAPSIRALYNQRDTFNVYVGGAKVNSTFLTYSNVFPSTTSNYIAVTPGDPQTIRLTVPGVVNQDSIGLINLVKTLKAGEYYTLLITDSIISTRDSSQIWMKDAFTTPTSGNYSMRFVHAALNDSVGGTVDVYSARRNDRIFRAVKAGGIVNFTTLPYNSQVSDTFLVIRTGKPDTLARLNTVSFGNQRVYTMYYRGDAKLTTGTKARGISTYVHN